MQSDATRLSSLIATSTNGRLSPEPVVYRTGDYVGALRRLVIFAVDGSIICLVAIPAALLTPLLSVIFAWCYLAVLKPSRFRSPGYWVADAKIITLDGQRPSPFRMTLRILWMLHWIFGWPIGFPIDWLWSTFDEERQMLRDLFAGTRLVRNSAQPIGPGKISYVLYTGIGLAVMYARVRPKAASTPRSPDASLLEMTDSISEPREEAPQTIRPASVSVIACPNCGARVLPKANRTCPSCQSQIVS